MIEFKVISSGSHGNAYMVTDGDSGLLLEAGIPIKDIRKAFDFKLSSISGCLVTHEHGDHSKSVQDVAKSGINVYMSEGTKNALGINHHRIKSVEPLKEFRIGDWRILPFDVQHDSEHPMGFLIMNKEGEKLVFATDTYYIRYKFKGLNIIAVECNYSEEILEQNILDGTVPLVMKKRLMRSHFSLEHVKDFLLANDLSEVKEIWLLHMSDNNSDEELFKREIQKITGKIVRIAGDSNK